VSRKFRIGVFALVLLLLVGTGFLLPNEQLLYGWHWRDEPFYDALVIIGPFIIPWGIWWIRRGK